MRNDLRQLGTAARLYRSTMWVSALVALLLVPTPARAQQMEGGSASESQGRIVTEVTSETMGELSGADMRDLSLLGSHALGLIGDARRALDADQVDEARQHMARALDLIGVIREMLPVTVQTLVVRNDEGQTLFEDTREIPEESIPLYTAVAQVNFLEPVVEAMQDDAEVLGVRLSDADLLHTHITLDIGVIERRLREAERTSQAADADAALVEAMAQGVQFTMTRVDEPLAVVRDAVWYAQRAAEAGNYASVQANLRSARQRLAVYRDLLPEDERSEAIALYEQLGSLLDRIQGTDQDGEPGGADVVAELEEVFDRVVTWFDRPASEVRVAQDEESEASQR